MKAYPLTVCAWFCGIVGLTLAGTALLPGAEKAVLPKGRGAYVVSGSLPSRFATQAAAADEQFVYAVDDAVIAKYDRATGKELARSTGEAKHLNSGFLWKGKLYCAHSNFPKKPHQSDIRVLDPETIRLIRVNSKADWTPAFVEGICRDLEHRHAPLLLFA